MFVKMEDKFNPYYEDYWLIPRGKRRSLMEYGSQVGYICRAM